MANYDDLSVKIVVDTKTAKSNVGDLTSSLTKLNEKAKELDKNQIEEVRKILFDISKIDFSNVARGLDSVVKAFKQLNTTTAKVRSKSGKELTGEMRPNVAPQMNTDIELPDFSRKGFDFDKIFGDFQKAEEAKSQIESLTNTFEDFNKQLFNEIPTATAFFTALENTTVLDLANQLERVADSSEDAGKGIKYITVNLGDLVDRVLPNAISGFSKLAVQFLRIVRYRIIRKVIQEIYKSLQEAVKRMVLFDKATNVAISNIKASFSYLTSALGNLLAPLIKTLEPLLTGIIDIFADLIMAVGNFFNALRGDAFVKATKQWEDYAQSLQKTKSIGIDELNIIGEEEKTYYIKVEGVEELNTALEAAEKLGVIVGTTILLAFTDWKKVLKEILKQIELAIPQVEGLKDKFVGLGMAIAGTVAVATSFADVMMNDLNWKNFTTLVGGATLAVIGLQIAFHKANVTASAGLVGSIFLLVAGIKDLIENGVNAQNAIVSILGVIGTAFSAFVLLLNTKAFSAIVAINGLRTALLSVGMAIGTLVGGAMLFIGLFQQVKAGWGQMNFWQKLASVIGLVLVAVGTLVATVSAFLQQWHIFAIAVAGIAVGTAITVGAYKSAEAPSYATGGFPEDGLFFANHNELVGRFSNGKTAVANNEEITAGIYEAVRDALRDSGSQGNVYIEMDGYQVARGVTRRQDNTGVDVIKGGKVNFGV